MDENELEQHLKRALAREEAPPWFEARVLNAANSLNRKAVPARASYRWWQWAAVMTMAGLAVVGVGAEWSRRVEERRAGEAAKAQLQLAFKITSAKLVEIQQKIDDARRDN